MKDQEFVDTVPDKGARVPAESLRIASYLTGIIDTGDDGVFAAERADVDRTSLLAVKIAVTITNMNRGIEMADHLAEIINADGIASLRAELIEIERGMEIGDLAIFVYKCSLSLFMIMGFGAVEPANHLTGVINATRQRDCVG